MTSRKGLTTLLELRPDGEYWRPDELGSMLRHQLEAPLDFHADWVIGSEMSPGEASHVRKLTRKLEQLVEQHRALAQQSPPINTFGDLFTNASPPLKLLELTKTFAKTMHELAPSTLPRKVALVLYYLTIATAYIRCDKRISALRDADLAVGLEWLLGEPWVDAASKEIIQTCRQRLAA